jgi:hypothetical protein
MKGIHHDCRSSADVQLQCPQLEQEVSLLRTAKSWGIDRSMVHDRMWKDAGGEGIWIQRESI